MKNPFLSPAFIEGMMSTFTPSKGIQVQQVEPFELDSSASILAALSQGEEGPRPLGHFGIKVEFLADGQSHQRKMVLKSKPHGRDLNQLIFALAQGCGKELATAYQPFIDCTGFGNSYRREGEIYQKLTDAKLMPRIYGVYENEGQETYLILMEYLDQVQLLNTVMNPEVWTDSHIRAALTALAEWHAKHLSQELPIDYQFWEDRPSKAYMEKLTPLWQALLDHHCKVYPAHFSSARRQLMQQFIKEIPTYWKELSSMPQTLIHNDFNPRNLCFRPDGQLVAYDWELATFHVPQYDVVEFLAFVLDEDRYHLRFSYLEHYRQALSHITGGFHDSASFLRGFELAARDFGLHRLALYLMAHTVSPYPFLPRVVESYFATFEMDRL